MMKVSIAANQGWQCVARGCPPISVAIICDSVTLNVVLFLIGKDVIITKLMIIVIIRRAIQFIIPFYLIAISP